jgi:hypothetical protein
LWVETSLRHILLHCKYLLLYQFLIQSRSDNPSNYLWIMQFMVRLPPIYLQCTASYIVIKISTSSSSDPTHELWKKYSVSFKVEVYFKIKCLKSFCKSKQRNWLFICGFKSTIDSMKQTMKLPIRSMPNRKAMPTMGMI